MMTMAGMYQRAGTRRRTLVSQPRGDSGPLTGTKENVKMRAATAAATAIQPSHAGYARAPRDSAAMAANITARGTSARVRVTRQSSSMAPAAWVSSDAADGSVKTICAAWPLILIAAAMSPAPNAMEDNVPG